MTQGNDAVWRRRALGVLMPGFVGTTLPEWMRRLLGEGLGGVCLFGHNVDTPEQVSALTDAIYAENPQAIISIDEEGGDVSRLHHREGSPFPGNAVLGRIDQVETTRSVARSVGLELRRVGVGMTLAPDADVNSNPQNPVIGVRSFGDDPVAVARHTAAWVDGIQGVGVAACAKHFPGHGDTSTDSHWSEPVVAADASVLATRELVPFESALDAGVKAIMTSHIRVPALEPDTVATFSASILHDLLRVSLGFDGLVVTDALDMAGASAKRGIPASAVAAMVAGSDLLCLGSNNSEDEIRASARSIIDAIGTTELSPDRLADAGDRRLVLAQWISDRHRTDASFDADAVLSPAVGKARVAESFGLSEHALTMLGSGPRPVRWVEIEAEPNVAVGDTPFGPFFHGGATASLVVPIDNRTAAADYVAEPGALTVIVGRDLHRDEGALDAARIIAARCPALIVDMGFAHCDAVDVATFGASRLAGEALLELLEAVL